MSFAKRLSFLPRLPTSGMRGAWWFARWLLVLILAFDHVSAPFHHHQHGADWQLGLGSAHDSLGGGETHADGDAHPLVSHSAMAIRIEPSRLGQLPAIDHADAQWALIPAIERLAAFDEPPPTHWQPDRSRPDFRSHRSLPPAGRAPPRRA